MVGDRALAAGSLAVGCWACAPLVRRKFFRANASPSPRCQVARLLPGLISAGRPGQEPVSLETDREWSFFTFSIPVGELGLSVPAQSPSLDTAALCQGQLGLGARLAACVKRCFSCRDLLATSLRDLRTARFRIHFST